MDEATRPPSGAATRRGLLVGTAAAAAGCARPDGAPAVHGTGGPRIRWRLASSFPESLDAMYGTAKLMCDEVAAATDGRFTIRPFPAGKLVPALGVLDSVQKGSTEMGQSASYYYTGKSNVLAFETCVPFGLTPRQQTAWLDEGGGAELLAPILADFGVVSLPAGNTGTQMGGWFRRRVDSLADLSGLKMRIPGLGSKVMAELGVAVKSLPGGEIYTALELGAIDATEWVGPYDDQRMGFHEVAQNYYCPGWWEPGPHLSYYVNRGDWEALPESYRAVLRGAARRAAVGMQARYDARNPKALRELVEKGVQVRTFSDDLMAGARDASEQLLSDQAAADPTYAKVLEQWRKFRDESFAWFGAAELGYARYAFGGR
ncbi:MAG: TRAP transporter substrate-binding protein DctP [Planctomycetota bacterium]